MKAQTLNKRLQSRYNGSKSTVAYRIVSAVINNENTKALYNGVIRPCYTSGRGRFTTNLDHTDSVIRLLTLIGLKFITGNDAPRKSATGNFIKIISKIER